jgi:hypothetical protein
MNIGGNIFKNKNSFLYVRVAQRKSFILNAGLSIIRETTSCRGTIKLLHL